MFQYAFLFFLWLAASPPDEVSRRLALRVGAIFVLFTNGITPRDGGSSIPDEVSRRLELPFKRHHSPLGVARLETLAPKILEGLDTCLFSGENRHFYPVIQGAYADLKPFDWALF